MSQDNNATYEKSPLFWPYIYTVLPFTFIVLLIYLGRSQLAFIFNQAKSCSLTPKGSKPAASDSARYGFFRRRLKKRDVEKASPQEYLQGGQQKQAPTKA
jgi:hypothetical protein